MRWSFFNIVLDVFVGAMIVVLAAYGVAILGVYALISAIRP